MPQMVNLNLNIYDDLQRGQLCVPSWNQELIIHCFGPPPHYNAPHPLDLLSVNAPDGEFEYLTV